MRGTWCLISRPGYGRASLMVVVRKPVHTSSALPLPHWRMKRYASVLCNGEWVITALLLPRRGLPGKGLFSAVWERGGQVANGPLVANRHLRSVRRSIDRPLKTGSLCDAVDRVLTDG